MIHEVATKPSRTSTKILPRQNGSRSSSIATEPCPCGLSRATRRYIGSMPEQRQRDDQQRRQRRQGTGGQRGDAGQVGQGGEVVDAGQAHDLPPRVRLGVLSSASGPTGCTRCCSSHRASLLRGGGSASTSITAGTASGVAFPLMTAHPCMRSRPDSGQYQARNLAVLRAVPGETLATGGSRMWRGPGLQKCRGRVAS